MTARMVERTAITHKETKSAATASIRPTKYKTKKSGSLKNLDET